MGSIIVCVTILLVSAGCYVLINKYLNYIITKNSLVNADLTEQIDSVVAQNNVMKQQVTECLDTVASIKQNIETIKIAVAIRK